MTLHVCKHSNLLCGVIFVNFYNFFQRRRHYVVTCQLSAQEIVNWVTTADGCVYTADATVFASAVFTPPTRRNSTVSSRRRRRCVLDIKLDPTEIILFPFFPVSRMFRSLMTFILHATTQREFRPIVNMLSTMMVVALIWHNFVKVADY